jgi:hypothetical protein
MMTKPVDGRLLGEYSDLVAKKNATGFGDLNLTMADNRPWRYFFVRATESPMSGSGGDTFGYAGFRCHRFANPATCCSPRLATGRAVNQPTMEAHMPGIHSPAISHTEQIRRLAGIADTIGAMLGTFALLPATGQTDALAVSASLADDLAQALATIAGEAV